MSTVQGGGKRLFLGLLLATGAILGGGGFLVWLLPRVYAGAATWLSLALGALLGGLALLLWAGIGILVFAILFERDLPGTRRLRGLLVRGFFPPLVAVARILGIPRERVERSFIAINNQLVLRARHRSPPSRVLILLPHCLQDDSCGVRITGTIDNCRRCGRCPIAGLAELGERHGVHLSVATGGTLARRIIVEKRPEMILAVACERDLTSGIQDAHPLPVYGVLNERPHGPCFNTRVDLPAVEAALRRLVAGGSPDTSAPPCDSRRSETTCRSAPGRRASSVSGGVGAPVDAAHDRAPGLPDPASKGPSKDYCSSSGGDASRLPALLLLGIAGYSASSRLGIRAPHHRSLAHQSFDGP